LKVGGLLVRGESCRESRKKGGAPVRSSTYKNYFIRKDTVLKRAPLYSGRGGNLVLKKVISVERWGPPLFFRREGRPLQAKDFHKGACSYYERVLGKEKASLEAKGHWKTSLGGLYEERTLTQGSGVAPPEIR